MSDYRVEPKGLLSCADCGAKYDLWQCDYLDPDGKKVQDMYLCDHCLPMEDDEDDNNETED